MNITLYQMIPELDDNRLCPPSKNGHKKASKKRNESQYFVNSLKPTAFIPRFA